MNTMDLLVDLHIDNSRQWPWSDDATRLARDLTWLSRTDHLHIADMGCGTGAQTLALAASTHSTITAIDFLPAFLERLEERADNEWYAERITTQAWSIDAVELWHESQDIIWSEWSAYNIGFETSIKHRQDLVKPGWFMVISEITWLKNSIPDHIRQHRESEYAEMGTIADKTHIIQSHGLIPHAHFILPPEAWMDNYYTPLRQTYDTFLQKHENHPDAQAVIEQEKHEVSMFEQHSDCYSYVFYVIQKPV